MARKIHVFDANLQKQLLSESDQNSKIKAQEFSKFITNKKTLIIIIFGQWDKATKIEIAVRTNYNTDYQEGNLTKFLNWVRTICFGSNDGGLSYRSYKQVVAVKLTNNYSNNKLHGLHGFKKEVKIKYKAVK